MNSRPNLVLAVVAAVVVVLAVVAAVVTSTRRPPDLDASTPAGTVQLFVLAVIDGDDEEAVALLDPALGCRAPLSKVDRPVRVSLAVAGARTDGDRATVVLDITEHGSGGMLDSWSHREAYELRQRGPGWMITSQPWPVYGCE